MRVNDDLVVTKCQFILNPIAHSLDGIRAEFVLRLC